MSTGNVRGSNFFQQNFLSKPDVDFVINVCDAATHETATLSLLGKQEDNFEALVRSVERMENRHAPATPPAGIIRTLNHLQAEGFLPPLLCLLLKKNANFIGTIDGRRIFERLGQALLVFCKKELREDEMAFLDRQMRANPEKFLKWLYLAKLERAVHKDQPSSLAAFYSTPKFNLTEKISSLENTLAREYLSASFLRVDPALKDDEEMQNYIATLTNYVKYNAPDVFIAKLEELFGYLETKADAPALQSLYFKELKEQIAKLTPKEGRIGCCFRFLKECLVSAKKQDPFVFLAHLLKIQDSYRALAVQTAQFSKETEEGLLKVTGFNRWSGIDRGDQAVCETLHRETVKTYHLCTLYLQDRRNLPIASATESARLVGVMTRTFRKLDNVFSKIAGRPLHQFCGCHLRDTKERDPLYLNKELVKGWPTLQNSMNPLINVPERDMKPRVDLQGRSMLIFSCRLGVAHSVVMDTFAKRAAREEAHAYNMDGLEEALLPLDFVYNDHSIKMKCITTLFGCFVGRRPKTYPDASNQLIQNNWWRAISFLRWVFLSKESTPADWEREAPYFIRPILERDVDLVMSSFSNRSGSISDAARKVGRPMYNTATDFDPELVDITPSTGAPSNPHFVHALFVDDRDALKFLNDKQGKPLLKPEQIVVGGFPVRRSFLTQNMPVAELRRKWHVDEEAQVVLILGGGNGVKNSFADDLVKEYRSKQEFGTLPNVHLFVVCGKNAVEEARLKKLYGKDSKEQSPIPVTVLGWTGEEQLGELYTLATAKNKKGQEGLVLSAKSGGGTMAELASKGVRAAALRGTRLVWEDYNIDYYRKAGMGMAIEKGQEKDFRPIFKMLETPKIATTQFDKIDSEGLSLTLWQQLITRAEKDPQFVQVRTSLAKV